MQSFYLVLPALSLFEYTKMKEIWGGNIFQMVLYVYNGRSYVKTNPILLKIVNNDENDSSGNPSSVPLWQIFVVVSGVVIVLIITVFVVYKVAMKNKMRRRAETQRQMILNIQY